MTLDIQSWQAIAGAVGILITTGYGAWQNRQAKKAAQKAAELSAPTGNGFAAKVMEKLERLETGQIRNDKANARVEKKLDDHIAAHANAEIAGHASHPRRVLRNVNEL